MMCGRHFLPLVAAATALCSPLPSHAQETIAPEDQAQSIVDAYSEHRYLPFFVQVIPLHAFNAALAAGGFGASSAPLLNGARKSFGLLSDPAVTGITSVVNVGTHLSFSGSLFLVVEDARYVYGTEQQVIEATKFFLVSAQISGFSDWIGSGSAEAIVHNPSPTTGPSQFPVACCPAEAYDGFLYGHRCVDPQSGATTSASVEAEALPVTGHPTAVFHLNDASTYPANGTQLHFADTRSRPAELSVEQCLACARTSCTPVPTPDAGVGEIDAGAPEAGVAGSGGGGAGNPSPPSAVHHAPPQCLSDGDCTRVQRCVKGACVARAGQPICLGAWCQTPGGGMCRVQADCGLLASCRDELCVPHACLADVDCPPKQRCLSRTCKKPGDPAAEGSKPAPPPGENSELSWDGIALQGEPGLIELQGLPRKPAWQPSADQPGVGFVLSGQGEPLSIRPEGQEGLHSPAGALLGGRCPADEAVSVAQCLDEDFVDSVCGARYTTEPVINGEAQLEGGERLGLCEQLIAQVIAREPKRRADFREPAYERICRHVERVTATPNARPASDDPRQGGAGPRVPTPAQPSDPPPAPARADARQAAHRRQVGVAGQEMFVFEPGAISATEDDEQMCHSELIPTGVAAVDDYNRDFQAHADLYRLDGHALAERYPQRRFLFDADEEFDRHEIRVSGATGTQGLKAVRRYALGSQVATADAQLAIDARENRWRGRNRMTPRIDNCDEYAFQRYYDYFRFEEQAALLGRDDWAIWRLAFGQADLPTSIGTRALDGTGLRDFKGQVALDGNYPARVTFHDPYRDARYGHYKNIYFTLYVSPEYRGEFFYRPLLQRGRGVPDDAYEGSNLDDGIVWFGEPPGEPNLSSYWFGESWHWHKAMGDALSAHRLSDFDAFETGDAKDFREARQAFYEAMVDAVRQGQAPDQRGHAQDCAQLAEALPRQFYGEPERSFRKGPGERAIDPSDDPFAAALNSAMGRNNACSLAETPALRATVERLDQLLTRAELKGYLAITRPSLADWSPRLFAQHVKGALSTAREDAFRKCVLYTNDRFDAINRHFQEGPNSGKNFTRDFSTLDEYFVALEQELENLPPELRGGGETRWDRHDAMQGGAGGFGYSFSYRGNVDISDYVATGDNPVLPGLTRVQFGFDAGAAIELRAFGQDIPVFDGSAELDSGSAARLPTVRVLDLDTLELETLVDGGRREAQAGHVPSFNFALDNYGRAVEFGGFETTIVAFAIPITISGGIAGFAGADTSMRYTAANGTGMPRSLDATLSPSVGASVFLEGGVSAGIASASVRTTLVLIEFAMPLTARVDLVPSERAQNDFELSFDLRGKADFEMLSGNMKVKLCVGVWPFRECWRKKLFEWDAALHTTQELFALSIEPFSLAQIVLGRKLALARECEAGFAPACEQQ